ncbi:MAG: radical SAM protein [Thermofilum sp.]
MQFVAEITLSCPARCQYCPLSGEKRRAVIPLPVYDEFLDAVTEVDEEPVLVLSGGEPSALGPALRSYVDRAKSRGIPVTVVTNAFDPRAVIESNPDLVEVSLDYVGGLHDAFRGLPLWERAVKLIESLPGKILIRATLYQDNVEHILELKRLFPETPLLVMPARGTGSPTPRELLRKLRKAGIFVTDNCPAGRQQIVVTPNGDRVAFLPCIFYREVLAEAEPGNLKKALLQAIERGKRVPRYPCEKGEKRG